MADEDLNTEDSEEDKKTDAAAEKAFAKAFDEGGNRDNDVHMVSGDDDSDDEESGGDDAGGSEADDTGDDDQGDDTDTDEDTVAGGEGDDGKQKDKGEAEPTIKDVIAMVQGMQTGMARQLSTMQSKLDKGLRPADVKAATQAAADTTKDAGKKVPTKDRVEQALKSVKGFADMEKDFPDYAAVLRESLTLLLPETEDKPAPAAPVDEKALVDKAVAQIRLQDQQAQAAQKEAEAEFARIEDAWPGWQPMLKGKDWETWSTKKLAGPDGKEYERIFTSGSTRETISVFQEFSKETGVQPKKKDGSQSAGAGKNQQAPSMNSDRQRRSASRPRGSASVTGNGKRSEEEIFEANFKERRGG